MAPRNDHELHYLEMPSLGEAAEVKVRASEWALAWAEVVPHGSPYASDRLKNPKVRGMLPSILSLAHIDPRLTHANSSPDVESVSGHGLHRKEAQRTNLNALGDSVVSFAVLALTASPDRRGSE